MEKRSVKKTAVTQTSIQAYRDLISSGQISKEKALAVKVMSQYNQPLTRRKLARISGLEITSLCRILYDLRNIGIVSITHYGPCEETKKQVGFFALVQGQLELL